MNPSTTQPTVRFAPSPTGFLHMGGVRTALFNFLFARQHDGVFVLRIEDTDKERSKEEWTEGLVADLSWLGLSHDVFAKQSEREDVYATHIQKLITSGHAYLSKETPKEVGQRDEVIRFKNPNTEVVIDDRIRGEVRVDTTDLGDFVIARSMTEPVYHLAVVIDDYLMGVTHVIRAEEHLSNTPRQILIQEALGAPRPVYAHLPLVLAEDKSKLSKRKHGETVSLSYYRDRGYLPEALVNFVALLGWNPGTDEEIFTLQELINTFDLTKVQKGGAVFNVEKLNWINREHIKRMTPDAQHEAVRAHAPESYDRDMLAKISSLVLERINAFGEIPDVLHNEFAFFFKKPEYAPELLVWKKSNLSAAKTHIQYVADTLARASEDACASSSALKDLVWGYAEKEGRGDVLWPVRVALSGQERSADPFTIAGILGKKETVTRLQTALEKITS